MIPAEFLDHVLRVARDFTWKLDGVDAANDDRVRLHWINAGERRAARNRPTATLSVRSNDNYQIVASGAW